MAFRNLGIKEEVIKVIEEENFEKPFEIQEKAIPFVLDGKDVIAQAATGSGKTLAFGAGIIHTCKREEKIQALVLVPTRELAEQVAGSMKKFSKYNFLKTTVIYGGVDMATQIKNLKNADIVVGTPGRILDYITRRTIDLKFLKILVLDESDRMLDMGFIKDVERIIKACPIKRQTLMFSATISPEITHLAKKYMINPMKVSVESYVDPRNLKQFFYDINERDKFSLLAHLLKNEDSELTMVFCATRRRVDIIAKKLDSQGIDTLAIHGGFPQNRRLRIMEEFQNKKIRILVCTDVAARGLDIKGVSHVYNYDIPNESKDYIHRIGRTARAGEKGKAISLVSNRDGKNFENIIRNPKLTIKKETLPEFERLSIETKVHDSLRKSGGRRNFRRERSIYTGRVNFGRRKGRFNRSYGNHNRDKENFEKPMNSKFSKKNFAKISFGNRNYAKFSKRREGRKYNSGRRNNWNRR